MQMQCTLAGLGFGGNAGDVHVCIYIHISLPAVPTMLIMANFATSLYISYYKALSLVTSALLHLTYGS
jgi:hypothetical protein